jgi:hypothetical protein
MAKFTVIGYNDYNGCNFVDRVDADNASAAISKSVAFMHDNSYNTLILGAVSGWVELFPPCEESGKPAYACDIPMDNVA